MTAIIERDDRLVVYIAGGITGGLMNQPVDITLDRLPDAAFQKVSELFNQIQQRPTSETPMLDYVGDFGYHVFAGNHDDRQDKLVYIFNGHFARQPKAVEELEKLLKQYAKPTDLAIKP